MSGSCDGQRPQAEHFGDLPSGAYTRGVWEMATLVKISWSVGGSKLREKIYEPHPVLGSLLGTEEGEKLLYKSVGQLRKSSLP